MASPHSESSLSSAESSLSPVASIASPGPIQHDSPSHDGSLHDDDTEDAMSTISSDTEGSIPGSQMDIEEDHEQVTFCNWENCNTELGNMDALVKHIHDEHIGTRRAKYACEWIGCGRIHMPHASGYALRAHMRSHTREKPFYCTLPECDRSFTRSDALAKHMRTVHETEALRPSDPIPKSHPNHPHNLSAHAYEFHLPSSYPPSPPSPTTAQQDGELGNHYFSTEDGFDADEARLPPRELYRLLKRKIEWAEEEREALEREKRELEEKRRECWVKKELMLEKVLRFELAAEEVESVVAM